MLRGGQEKQEIIVKILNLFLLLITQLPGPRSSQPGPNNTGVMAVKTRDKTLDKITLALSTAQGGQQNLYSSANCLMDRAPVWWGVYHFSSCSDLLFGGFAWKWGPSITSQTAEM